MSTSQWRSKPSRPGRKNSQPIKPIYKLTNMKPKMKFNTPSSSSPRHRRIRPPSLHLHRPRFIIMPFFGSRIRAILEGEETWYLREDVLNALGLKEAPRWNQHLFARTQRTTAVWTDSEERTSRYCVISESGFYKLLCLGRLNDVGLTFNHEGGNLIYNMPGPGEGFDTEQREFFRNLLRSLHSNWLRYDAPADDLDEWDLPA